MKQFNLSANNIEEEEVLAENILLLKVLKKADLEIERLFDFVFDHKKCYFERDNYETVIGRVYICRNWRYKPDSMPLEKTISAHIGSVDSLEVLKNGTGIVSLSICQTGQTVLNVIPVRGLDETRGWDTFIGDGEIKVWNSTTGDLLRTISGPPCHLLAPTSTILQDGSLACGYDDHTIKIWKPQTGDFVRTIQAEGEHGLACLLDGSIACISDLVDIQIWNHVTGDLIRTITGKFYLLRLNYYHFLGL